jgi:hypothetical protein
MKIVYIILLIGLFFSCTGSFDELNENPNQPISVPTTTLMNNAQKTLIEDIRDDFFSGRMALVWTQYWAQTDYTTESRYQYSETSNNNNWKDLYTSLMDLQRVIELNTDEETASLMSAYGTNNNQIAASRIMKSWVFHLLTDIYGPIPYHSYGSDDDEFQALGARSEDLLSPVYASQEKVYRDILKELSESVEMLDLSKPVFTEGDNIYNGDAAKWRKFANSLILRVAMRMSDVDANTANTYISTAISSGVMESNNDNAVLFHESEIVNASPMHRAFTAHIYFSMSNSFIDLLKGDRGPFGTIDPRMYIFAAPYTFSVSDILKELIPQGDDTLYRGQPYGVEDHIASSLGIGYASMPNAPLQATFGEMFMDYSETCFLLSEINGWDQSWYEKGVRASMERWEVDVEDIDTYMGLLPAASQENVLTQKYIALYMQPFNAWSEYRRTGFPTTLIKPGDVSYVDKEGVEYKFIPLVEELNDLPARIGFPQDEQLLNPYGYATGVSKLEGKDDMTTRLWWDIDL